MTAAVASWTSLKKRPLVGLSPMDGVTDPAYRAVVDEIGQPDLLYTEFVSADGLCRGIPVLLEPLIRKPSATPLIAQIFSGSPESVYEAALLLATLGVDGIDINMGCPNRCIISKGGGAALIQDAGRAIAIIRNAKQAVREVADGKQPDFSRYPNKFRTAFRALQDLYPSRSRHIPVSVKTRIGFRQTEAETWIPALISAGAEAIAIHGRLYTQMHSGPVIWEEVAKAAALCRTGGVICLGNGGIRSAADAEAITRQYRLDGALIGQAAFGNPWAFTAAEPTLKNRLDAARLHCDRFVSLMPGANPLSLRKHLAWYIKGFPNAGELRNTLMTTVNDVVGARQFIESLTQFA